MKSFFITMMAAISSLLGCQAQSFRSVEVEEFEKIIADSAVVRLDVRTDKEFAEGHIAGTVCIDVLHFAKSSWVWAYKHVHTRKSAQSYEKISKKANFS